MDTFYIGPVIAAQQGVHLTSSGGRQHILYSLFMSVGNLTLLTP